MSPSDDDFAGCRCLVLILLAICIGGGFWQGAALLAAGWLAYLIFIGVSIGLVIAIIEAISGG